MAEILKKELDSDPVEWAGFENGLVYTGPGAQNCPICGEGLMRYDGGLHLVCDHCGFVDSDSFSENEQHLT
jgi:uncharacterized protein (DUF983 family)